MLFFHSRRLSLLTLLTFALAGTCALAQSNRAVILGTVTDPSGSAVAGAKVTVQNQNTNISATVTTSPEGQYTVTNLEPGAYRVTVTAQGFAEKSIRDITVFVNQTARVDVGVEVGSVSTRVEVEAAAPVVQSEASSIGQVVDSQQVVTMPLDGRSSIYGLLALTPGVMTAGQNPVISGGVWFGSTNLTVDGVSDIDTGNERLGPVVPSLESIGEFKVIASGASAEFGRGGAQVLVQTKSGTNQFHGSLFEFNRNRTLAAKNFFATSLPKPAFNRNEYGGSLGGPVLKDKLFFFGSFEGLRRVTSSPVITAQPTDALKSGNFTGLAAIRDPDTNAPFPGNQIPSGRISSAAQALLKFTSAPNLATTAAAGLGNNFVYNTPTREGNDRYTARLDYQLSSKDKITGRYYFAGDGPYQSGVGNATDKYGNWGGFGASSHNAGVSYTRLISPTMINEVRFGFLQINYFRTPQNNTFDPSPLIPGLIPPVTGLGGLPTVSITGFAGFFDQPGSGDLQRDYEIYDNLSWVRGAHSIKVGGEYQRVSAFNFQNPAPARGSFAFDGRYTGNAFADFLLGDTLATARTTENLETQPLNNRGALFAQDDWTVSSKLTLNLGLRWQYEGPFQNGFGAGNLANFDPHTGKIVVLQGTPNPLFAGLPIVAGQSVGLDSSNYMIHHWHQFEPRFGFAYRPLGTARFVVRGSYGIFHDVIPGYAGTTGLPNNPPFQTIQTFAALPGNTPSLTFANAFPGTPTIPANATLNAVARDRTNGYMQQWNFTLEGEVAKNTSVRASYLGNKGTHLGRQLNLNDPGPAPGVVQPRRPYQPWGNINYYESGANSFLNQVQFGVVRRFASGFSFQAEYQFSKELSEQPYGISAPTSPFNARLDWGNADFVRTHYVIMNYSYDLPFGKGRRFALAGVADKVFGGWQIAGISSLGTGQPFSVTFNSTVVGWPSSRADIVGNPNGPGTIAQWFNPAAYAVPAPYTYGNSARNSLFGPGIINWDQAVYKRTNISDRISLEFRAEFFNILNHANFDVPASNISVPSQVGRITATTNSSRDIQFGMRLAF
ncbi:MAG TPA: carboxypeptidase regulatory-like domain-containing protein [Bryobacterales bacterium]|nr:carboxypeptidase regulatory-like domain-containing protein [Bryobacterales bacterium]